MKAIIAVDPGREKTGIAVVQADLMAIHLAIVPTLEISTHLAKIYDEYHKNYEIEYFVCGDGTNHRRIFEVLQKLAEDWQIKTCTVDEKFSTQEGKKRYWHQHKPTGWRRLLPTSWLTPPVNVDDYTAWIIGERFLTTQQKENHERKYGRNGKDNC